MYRYSRMFIIGNDDDSDSSNEEFPTRPAFVNYYSEKDLENERIARANKYKLTSLETLCIRVAVKYAYEYQKTHKQREGTGHFIFINGPFEGLPSSILGNIYDEYEKMSTKNNTSSSDGDTPEIFITKHTQCVKLFYCWRDNLPKLLTLKYRCREKLRKLSLTHCPFMTYELLNILSSFTNLVELDFSYSQISNDLLAFIAIKMTSLRALNLTRTCITNEGLKCLLEIKLESLKELKLKNLNVSVSLLVEILKFYPELELLENLNTSKALKLWHEEFPDKNTKLQYLDYICSEDTASNYKSVMQYCPDLKNFTIRNADSRINLNIVNPWSSTGSLTTVHFTFIKINITDLISAFPTINDLSLTGCKLKYTAATYKKEMIKKIKKIYLYACKYQECFDLIKDIFYSENLELVKIWNCHFSELVTISSEPMYFNSLRTNCLDKKWLVTIIMRNKNLQNIELAGIDASTVELNSHLKIVLQGKRRLFSQFQPQKPTCGAWRRRSF